MRVVLSKSMSNPRQAFCSSSRKSFEKQDSELVSHFVNGCCKKVSGFCKKTTGVSPSLCSANDIAMGLRHLYRKQRLLYVKKSGNV